MRLPIILLTILFFSNIPSIYYQWYIKVSWFDASQHFLGGFFVAMLVWAYLKDYLGSSKIKNLIIILGITSLVGVAWELAEYFANQILVDPIYKIWEIRAYFIGDLRDTLADLFLAPFGAFVFFLLHLLRHRDAHKG